MIVHLVRHGEVDNPQGVYYGRLPGFHLSANGRQQAGAAAATLRAYPIAALFSSPLERALETAQIIAQGLEGIPIQSSELLVEVHSPFDGQPTQALLARGWDVYSGSPPPYEQPADVLRRVQQFTRQVRAAYPERQVVAVTHGDLLAAAVLWARGQPLTPHNMAELYQGFLKPASIASFVFETGDEEEVPRLMSQ
jgi:broad specificity phosphatase PhoE